MRLDYTAKLKKIESYLTHFLPQNADKSWQQQAFSELPCCLTAQHAEGLLAPCRDLVARGGKRWRPLLLVLCAEAAAAHAKQPHTDLAYELTPLVEFVHTASLIHDDIEDSADTRRGKPAVHIAYGLDTALNAGSWLYFQAAVCIEAAPADPQLKAAIYALYMEQLRRLHLGQALDIGWHRTDSANPSIDEYIAMVMLKTGTLAALAAGIGTLVGSGSAQLAQTTARAAASIGAAFQIYDDIANLTAGNPGKKRGDDIVEGKKSLPLLLHLKQHPEQAADIAAYLAQAKAEGIDSPAVDACIARITSGSALDDAKQQATAMLDGACADLTAVFADAPAEAKNITDFFNALLTA